MFYVLPNSGSCLICFVQQAVWIFIIFIYGWGFYVYNHFTMDKQIKVGHFLLALFSFAALGVGAWVNLNRETTKNETEIKNLKENYTELRNTMHLNDINQYTRHAETMKAINDLRIIVENKQNRK
jgi:hypothetical protein